MSITTKYGRVVTYHEGLPPTKSHDLWSGGGLGRSGDKLNRISTTAMPLATKLGRMLTYLEEFLLIRSDYPLIAWSCEITCQIKSFISPLPQCLWPPNFAGCDIQSGAPIHKVAWPFYHVVYLKLCNKLHYSKAYYCQTLKGGDSLWGASPKKSHKTFWTGGNMRSHDKLKT